MIVKFLKFIKEELDYTTLYNVSKKLKELGHTTRATNIDTHRGIHSMKLKMMQYYGDLIPFEIYAEKHETTHGDLYVPSNTEKMTVYLADWEIVDGADAECEVINIWPTFIFNTEYPLKPNDMDIIEHQKGINDYLENEGAIAVMTLDIDNNFEYTAWEAQDNYIRFTNRRDAVRFRNLIKKDRLFRKEYNSILSTCDKGILPSLLMFLKEFYKNVSTNMLYKG